MTIVRGADIVVQGDLGTRPFVLDRDTLDTNPGSELTPAVDSWDDITCDVLSIQWTWGSGDPLGPLTEVEGGRASVNLHDAARDYDPSNAASPYFNFLRVGMPLRVLVDGSPGWTGTLEAWEWDTGDQVATLLAIDAVATLAALVMPVATAIAADTTAGQAGAVLDSVGWPVANRVFSGTSAASRMSVTLDGQAMEALHAIRFAELGAMFGTRAGAIAYWARGTTSATPVVLINCGGVGLVGLASVFNRGRVRNVVRIDDTVAPYTAVLSSSATRHGARTVATGNDELQYPVAGRAAAFGAWSDTILGALGNPRPASRLGTLVPVGAAQVDAILRAEWGDVWRIVDTGSTPPIDRTVRVLGERVSITPTTVEVDAVTEDLTGDLVPAVPGAPVLVSATPGDAQVTLVWTAPASPGGTITGYTVTASPGGATCTTTGLSCIVTGLTNGTLYTFTVKATNAIGTGPASNALTATPVYPWGAQERMYAATAPASASTGNFTLGERFSVQAAGQITHLRYWHMSGCPGGTVHKLTLWTQAGARLVSVNDPAGGAATGWREVALPTPYAVNNGDTLSVSWSSEGYNYGWSAVSVSTSLAPHLTMVSAVNCWYSAGSDVFPATVYANKYHVDVVYRQALLGRLVDRLDVARPEPMKEAKD